MTPAEVQKLADEMLADTLPPGPPEHVEPMAPLKPQRIPLGCLLGWEESTQWESF